MKGGLRWFGKGSRLVGVRFALVFSPLACFVSIVISGPMAWFRLFCPFCSDLFILTSKTLISD